MPLNQDLFQPFNNGQLQVSSQYPPAKEDHRILPLQEAILELRDGNYTRWSFEQDLNCWVNFTDTTAMTRPNIVILLDWRDPDSNNTALLVGLLGYYGNAMLLPCPKAWYESIPYGLQFGTPRTNHQRSTTGPAGTKVVPPSTPISAGGTMGHAQPQTTRFHYISQIQANNRTSLIASRR